MVNFRPEAIADPFPDVPGTMRRAAELIDVARRADPEEMADAGDLTNLPRPWDPATCPDDLREAIWTWCDEVAQWLNHEYVWRPAHMIPPCWPRHPHIARELAVLAYLRWVAEEALAPGPTEDWHRYTYPTFLERMSSRLGESTCRTGKHQDWPAEGRFATYTAHEGVEDRQRVILADTRPVTLLAVRRAEMSGQVFP